MKRNIWLYSRLLRIAVIGKIQYKTDFLVGIVSIVILNIVNISLIGVLIYNFHTLNGWGIWDLLFLYSFWMLSRGIYGTFFWHLEDLEELIITGDFDAYLIRPLSPFLQLLGKNINYTGIGDFLVGVLGFLLAKQNLNIHWSGAYWVFFVVCIFSGATIQIGINWAMASLCFWITRANFAMQIADRFTVLMQQYPVSIFSRWFRVVVTGFLPVAFINYYPSTIFLHKLQNPPAWMYLSPLVAVATLGVASFIWVNGVKRYSGTGN